MLATFLLLGIPLPPPVGQGTEPKLVVRQIATCDDGITELALDPAGQTLFVATERGEVATWDLKKEEFRWTLKPQAGPRAIIGLDAGPELVTVTAGGGGIGLIDAQSGARKRVQIIGKGQGDSTCLAHDPKGTWTWVGMKDGALYRVRADAEVGLSGVLLENKGVTAMALDSDAKQLVVGGADGTIRFVNARTGSVDEDKIIKAHEGPVTALVWTRGDASIVSGSQDRSVRGWKPSTRSRLFTIESLPGVVTSVAADPTGKLIAWGDDQGTAHVWEVSKQKTLAELKDDTTGRVGELVFLDKGKSLAAAMGRRHVAVWDLTMITK